MAIKTRDEIEEKYKWDLSKIYASEDDWFKDYKYVQSNCDKYLEFKDKLNSADMILKYYEFHQEIRKKFDAVYSYAFLKFNEDTANVHYQELREKARKLSARMRTRYSCVLSELRKLSKEDFDRFMEEEPKLKIYNYNLNNILNNGTHKLPKEEAELISSLRKALNNPTDAFKALIYSDMKFGTIKDGKGNEVELSDNIYSKYISDNDRTVRKNAFYTLYQRYEEMQNIFANLYSAKVNIDNVIALRKGYSDAREAALFGNKSKLNIYDNLLDVLHQNLYIMDDYYALKKEVMGLDEIHVYDIYAPLVPSAKHIYTFEEAEDIVLNALSVLGDKYINDLKRAFDEKWIDVMPYKGKANTFSWCSYTINPYILLNFMGTFNSISDLAHELGHSMHTYYSNKHNPYVYYRYDEFIGEVASQVNELILIRYLINHTNNQKEKLSILDNSMEFFKSTIVRQTMFAEFEYLTHKKEQEGTFLTSEFLSDTYYELYKKYSGNNMISDKEIRYEWSKIPHFFNYDFYVYQYATGLAIASYIVTNIMSGDKNFLSRYLKFLTLGESMSSVEELKMIGVDISDSNVIQAAMDMFKANIDEFKKEKLEIDGFQKSLKIR